MCDSVMVTADIATQTPVQRKQPNQQCSNMVLNINVTFLHFLDKALGCIYGDVTSFTMQCPHPSKIHIVSSTLGISECRDDNRCCPSTSICTTEATSEQLQNVMQACDGKQTCRVAVAVRRQRCPAGSYYTYTDLESVTYTCDTPQGEVTTQLSLIPLSLVFTIPTLQVPYSTL